MHTSPRGFALILSVILTSVALAIGLALLDVAYKQTIIATTVKQSGIAFYNADSAMECALYNDQVNDAFNYSSASGAGLTCSGRAIPAANFTTSVNGATRTSIFTIPCASSGIIATVTVVKTISLVTTVYANGYNSCNTSDPRRIERGLKIAL